MHIEYQLRSPNSQSNQKGPKSREELYIRSASQHVSSPYPFPNVHFLFPSFRVRESVSMSVSVPAMLMYANQTPAPTNTTPLPSPPFHSSSPLPYSIPKLPLLFLTSPFS